jgi:hypothetical protein
MQGDRLSKLLNITNHGIKELTAIFGQLRSKHVNKWVKTTRMLDDDYLHLVSHNYKHSINIIYFIMLPQLFISLTVVHSDCYCQILTT